MKLRSSLAPRRIRAHQRLASIAIVLVLGLQCLAASRIGCTPEALARWMSVHVLCAPTLWPFLDYPMFKDAHRVSERLTRVAVVVVFDDGSELVLRPEVPALRDTADAAIDALRRDDAPHAARILAPYVERDGRRCVELAIERQVMVLHRDGFRGEPAERTSVPWPAR